MDYIDIKHALEKKGYTLSKVARELQLSGPGSVADVLRRRYPSARVEKRVAEILGLPLCELFPQRYPATEPPPVPERRKPADRRLCRARREAKSA